MARRTLGDIGNTDLSARYVSGATVPKAPALKTAAAAETRAVLDGLGAVEGVRQTSSTLEIPPWRPTRPRSPRVLRRGSGRVYEEEAVVYRPFVARKMPAYPKGAVRATRKSVAAAEGRVAVPVERVRRTKSLAVLRPTKPEPFALKSVERHGAAMERWEQQLEDEKEAERKRRVFMAVPLREEILAGATFVPAPSSRPLTEPVDLLPMAKLRSERTAAFEARQRERVAELERMRAEAQQAREEEEAAARRREYQKNRFRPRPMPSGFKATSRYSVSALGTPESVGTRGLDGVRGLDEVGTPDTTVESESSDSESEEERAGMFHGLRKSLEPLWR